MWRALPCCGLYYLLWLLREIVHSLVLLSSAGAEWAGKRPDSDWSESVVAGTCVWTDRVRVGSGAGLEVIPLTISAGRHKQS